MVISLGGWVLYVVTILILYNDACQAVDIFSLHLFPWLLESLSGIVLKREGENIAILQWKFGIKVKEATLKKDVALRLGSKAFLDQRQMVLNFF